MKIVNLFLIGPGLIGGTLLNQLAQSQAKLKSEKSFNLKLIGLANSKKMIINTREISLADWKNQFETKATDSSLSEFVRRMKELKLANSVFVDCTASDAPGEFYPEILSAGISIVTPNKKANSSQAKLYQALRAASQSSGAKFVYEANVGAGLPVLKTLQTLLATGDKILRIEGILSGTLSFLFNSFDGRQPFSVLVKSAQEKGYTEPDPRDDLNGMDVARKILILARETGVNLELEDVEVENLVPKAARAGSSIDEFFKKLAESDGEFAQKLESARNNNQVLRYIAKFENGQATVRLESVDSRHPFYALDGSDNIISFTTKRYHDRPLVIKGPGAGAEVTAAGVFGDILDICN